MDLKFIAQVACSLLVLFFVQLGQASLTLDQYFRAPKLMIIVVIDQFRADELTRWAKEFKAAGTAQKPGGFNYLMQNGAYFPFAEYDVLQSMTCPGHAMIVTGAYPQMNGVALNEWYDLEQKKSRYCTDSLRYGQSPENLKGSTFSDEYKMTHPAARIISIALKDRAAIMLGGHTADHSLWFDEASFHWVTSPYFDSTLPAWVERENQKIKPGSMASAYGTQIIFSLATAALKSEGLGHHKDTDFLFLSLSNHDYVGHAKGPLSNEIHDLTLAEDTELMNFLHAVERAMPKLKDVAIILTADHGVSPIPRDLQKFKIESGQLDYPSLIEKLKTGLDKKFKSAGDQLWISDSHYLQFYFNRETLDAHHVSLHEALETARKVLTKQPGVRQVFTREDAENQRYPEGELGEQLKRQYLPQVSGDFILIPEQFYSHKDRSSASHMTGYSYDRQVPLIILGPNVEAGVRTQQAKIISLAPTLSLWLGSTAPSGSFAPSLPVFKSTAK